MDVVDLVPLIDRFDNPASVLPYVEHPHPRVRLAVAQWFGPGLVGTDPWIRSKSMDLYPEMRVVERRPDMPIGLFTVLVADPDPDVQMAALRRCWDVSLLVGLVDPRALLAGTAAETAGDPVARTVNVLGLPAAKLVLATLVMAGGPTTVIVTCARLDTCKPSNTAKSKPSVPAKLTAGR